MALTQASQELLDANGIRFPQRVAETSSNSTPTDDTKDLAMVAVLIDPASETLVSPPTLANQAAMATSLASIASSDSTIAARTPALGQAAGAGSVPVVIASDQNALGVVGSASAAAGGVSSWARLVSAAASTNANVVKASAGRTYSIFGYNAAGSVRYLKLYNKATAPTVGSDTPLLTLPLPPGVGFAFDFGLIGAYFSTGVSFALTTGSADADTGALTAADVVGLNIGYT